MNIATWREHFLLPRFNGAHFIDVVFDDSQTIVLPRLDLVIGQVFSRAVLTHSSLTKNTDKHSVAAKACHSGVLSLTNYFTGTLGSVGGLQTLVAHVAIAVELAFSLSGH